MFKTVSHVEFIKPDTAEVQIPEDMKQEFETSEKAEQEAEEAGYAAQRIGVYAAKFQALYNQMYADFKDDKSSEYHGLSCMIGGDDINILQSTEALIKLCHAQRAIALKIEENFSEQAEDLAQQESDEIGRAHV